MQTDTTKKNQPVKELIEKRRKSFAPYQKSRIPEINCNIAYVLGFQHVGIDGGAVVSLASNYPDAVTANKIGPAVQNDIAQATKASPKFETIPVTTDENDRAGCVVGEKLIGHLQMVNDFTTQRGEMILWYDVGGIAWKKNYWCPNYRVIGHNPEPEQEGYNPDMLAGELVYEGEAVSEIVSPNEIIFDYRGNINKLPWIIHARPMTRSSLKLQFGDVIDGIDDSKFKSANSDLNEFEIKLFEDFNNTLATNPTEELASGDKVIDVFEMWQVRDGNWPEGVYAVMVGDEVIINQPYPIEVYPHGQIPFTPFAPMSIKGKLIGAASRVSQARPLQRELNELRTLIKENMITVGAGIWSSPRDAKVKVSRAENGVGLVVEYDGAIKPDRSVGSPLPGGVFAYTSTIENDISEIFAFHEVSKGQVPTGGPKSGVGIHLLQEKDMTQSAPIITALEKCEEKALRQLLSIATANYNNRTLNIIGKDNEWALFEYNPEAFNAKIDVKVRTGSSLPINKALERELTLTLGGAGWLGNPADPIVRKRVLEAIDIGGLDKTLKDNNKDVNFAKKEFLVPVAMYQKIAEQIDWENTPEDQLAEMIYFPPINEFDNHEIHYIEHKNDLVDKYHDLLKSGDPGLVIIAKSMKDHLNQHAMILQQQALQAALMSGQIKPEKKKEKE